MESEELKLVETLIKQQEEKVQQALDKNVDANLLGFMQQNLVYLKERYSELYLQANQEESQR
jgi:hypothetical protein